MEDASNASKNLKKHNSDRNRNNRIQRKKPPPKPRKRQNDVYITTKSNFKVNILWLLTKCCRIFKNIHFLLLGSTKTL